MNTQNHQEAAPAIYETRAVAFLDILRFSDMILSGGAEEEIADVLQELKVRAAEVEGGSGSGRMQFSAFSDSIVVSECLLDGFGADRIAGYAGDLSLDLLARGFLVRGGLSVGDLHHRNGTVFGPALIEAYHLESKLALFPRVVVTEEFRAAVLRGAISEGSENVQQSCEARANALFRTDFDGMVHIDIFGESIPFPSRYLEASGLYSSPESGVGTMITADMSARAAWNSVRRTRELRYKAAAKQKYDWTDSYLHDATARRRWPSLS